jgi:hypothetical protein
MVMLPDPVRSFRANTNANVNNANGNNVNSNNASILSSSSSSLNSDIHSDGTTPITTATTTTLPSMENLSVGFLGCGTIASSIARGLSKAAFVDEKQSSSSSSTSSGSGSIGIQTMVVSKRSESKSKALFDDLSPLMDISVTTDNQAILDACDLIFLTVLPQQASEVLQGLEFDPNRHVLVSLVVS